ncbi:kinase-like domain-containing protein [Lipomyces oligophaga]|uniref:kinase-like domain-containing protein n=1 Tax=Lipomyces oligophaga TaxID=45792 RepID=UPI0034CE5F19
MPLSSRSPLGGYKVRRDNARKKVLDRYEIIGYIAAGTYGRVYKARSKYGEPREFAIKKFKADKEGEVVHYTGISQSACREITLCRELSHLNITTLVEIILEDKCIYMVFEFAEHDLLQLVHFHSHPDRRPIPESEVKSILWQLLNGVSYLHQNWVLHRDLKPANIMVTADGTVKIGDLGLARLFYKPLQPLYTGDKVVVTIWYRAPELLLGSHHYTPAVDMWAVGCIFAELLALRPIFKGEEAKMDSKKTVPFQRNQMQKIIEILGTPTKDNWPALPQHPEYHALSSFKMYPNVLESWYNTVTGVGSSDSSRSLKATATGSARGLNLLQRLLEYNPLKRLTAEQALQHPYFSTMPKPTANIFEGVNLEYPRRRISNEDNDIKTASLPGTKRTGLADDSLAARKKIRNE